MVGRRIVARIGVVALAAAALACQNRSTVPASLSDQEFWQLTTGLSEPPGTFAHSENLVSNELQFVNLVRLLRSEGGVYIGVGPEQNFSYIAALRPRVAFIIDIRRENRNLHLLYKALFEISANRLEFLSRLFSRERPAGLSAGSSVDGLFDAFGKAQPDARVFAVTRGLVQSRLADVHRFPLTTEDLNDIDHVLHAFFDDGPDITYNRSNAADDEPRPTYRTLMTVRDLFGEIRSYLASEDTFTAVKALQEKNLIVPVVGDFSGPRAIRGVGEFVRQRRSTVSAFYASNVEVYLHQQKTMAFCANLATLPHTPTTWFITSKTMKPFPAKLKTCPGSGQ